MPLLRIEAARLFPASSGRVSSVEPCIANINVADLNLVSIQSTPITPFESGYKGCLYWHREKRGATRYISYPCATQKKLMTTPYFLIRSSSKPKPNYHAES